MRVFKLLLIVIWSITLAVVLLQNRAQMVTLTLVGAKIGALSLSLALLLAYGVGIALGLLLLGFWGIHDLLLNRQANRYLTRLAERLNLLESQRSVPSYLPSNENTVVVESSDSDWKTERWDP